MILSSSACCSFTPAVVAFYIYVGQMRVHIMTCREVHALLVHSRQNEQRLCTGYVLLAVEEDHLATVQRILSVMHACMLGVDTIGCEIGVYDFSCINVQRNNKITSYSYAN